MNAFLAPIAYRSRHAIQQLKLVFATLNYAGHRDWSVLTQQRQEFVFNVHLLINQNVLHLNHATPWLILANVTQQNALH